MPALVYAGDGPSFIRLGTFALIGLSFSLGLLRQSAIHQRFSGQWLIWNKRSKSD